MKCFNFFLVFIFERGRERQSMRRGGAERERETQNPKQDPGSELSAQSPIWGLNSWTMRSWPEQKSDTQPTEPPRCPTHRQFWTWHALCLQGRVRLKYTVIPSRDEGEMEALSWRRMAHALESQASREYAHRFRHQTSSYLWPLWHVRQATNFFELQFLLPKNDDDISPYFLGCCENQMR